MSQVQDRHLKAVRNSQAEERQCFLCLREVLENNLRVIRSELKRQAIPKVERHTPEKNEGVMVR